jgi:hypothetical protein
MLNEHQLKRKKLKRKKFFSKKNGGLRIIEELDIIESDKIITRLAGCKFRKSTQ